ncbi:MAG: LLM class flavin-dependent oxidoreductase [Gammaproteobacteria bacterium]
MLNYSILDLAPVCAGSTPVDTFKNSADLARHVESLGYKRYWLAEHHNMAGIASSATSVVIAHIASNTKSIRVGAGGIMLPNHSPLVIAEQFGTLASLYPNRIDLGLGRAPGSDMRTARALRRDIHSAESFPQDVAELQALLGDEGPINGIQAVPGFGTKVPLWILGSSLFGAQLAAVMGLPFGFASHFAPDALSQAVRVYRENFQPSEQLKRPYLMLGINVIAAETDAVASNIFTSLQQQFVNLFRGAPGQLQPPIDDIDSYCSPAEKAGIERALKYTFTGSPETVKASLAEFVQFFEPDELMIGGQIYEHQARRDSFEIAATVCRDLGTEQAA